MPDRPLSDLEDLVGESRVTVRGLHVEAGKVEEFARAIHEDDPVYRDGSVAARRGHDRVPAPLTFTRTSFFPRHRPEGVDAIGLDLGFDLARTVHGAHEFTFERPAYVGDTLTGTSTVVDIYRREGDRGGTMTFAEVATDYVDGAGTPVCTSTTTIIETGGIDPETDDGDAPGDDAGDQGRADRDGHRDDASHDAEPSDPARVDPATVAVGDTGPTVLVEDLQRRDFVKYAGASGDFYPIHYDEPYARAAGHPSVFGQGMLSAAFGGRVLTDWFGLDRVRRYGVRFEARVWPGDTLEATGEVTDTAGDTADLDLTVLRVADREPVVTGSATVGPAPREGPPTGP